ncbi:MAG: LamG domain-containing protein, partial [Bacteroidota bacterium]
MKNIKQLILVGLLLCAIFQKIAAQSSPNCATASDNNFLTGKAFFNYGSVSNSFNTKNRVNLTVGQPVVGTYFGQLKKGTFGFWSRFLLPPAAPVVIASEGDLEDRIQVDWNPDPLSPAATGYKIYRNGSLLASVDGETFSFLDFNVIAGKFYTYEVAGVNVFGEGTRGANLGFLNPNGVVTGQVKSLSGNPVPGAIVTLTPTIGTAAVFAGDDMAFAEYNPVYPRNQFTLSCWVKLDAGNNSSSIFDLGSTISKNWWLHTLPAASGKGIRFGMGNGVGNVTEMDYAFPAATANDWHYITTTYNGASALLYVDGELIQTAVASIASDSIPLFVGQNALGAAFYKGKLDELRFFNRQLSQTEIQMFMNRTVSPTAAGLVNYWKFDEGVGTKSFDLTATKQKLYFCGAGWTTDKPAVANAGMTNDMGFYEIPGVNYGAGTTFTARPSKNFYYNQSLEFNSVNQQYAELTDFDLADSSTVEVTVKAFDFASNQCLLTKQNGGTTNFALNLNAGHILLEMGGASYDFGTLGMGFHRLSFVINQVAGSSSAAVTYYKDGAFVGSHTFTGVPASIAGGSPWTLGARRNGSNLEHYFSGLIDDVAFYSDLVSLPDLQTAANIGTNVTYPKLVNYFPLNEGSGTKVKDYGTALSGNGTIYGATYSTVAAIAHEEPHKFTPSTRLVTLNPSNTSTDQVDFSDQSTVPVSGYVRFDGTTCFQKGVEILVNGNHYSPPIFTDSTGYFSIDFEPGATAQLTPVFKQHTFYPAFWEVENVASPVAGILFRNQTKRSISGQMAGNAICRKSIIPNGAVVRVKVETLDGCYYKEMQITNSNGVFKFDKLPPLKFTVAVTEHSNNIIYNYFQLKGGVTVDLTDVSDTTDFIYYSQPQIEMTVLDTNSCGVSMLEQDGKYSTTIRVYQQYDGGRCYLDTALLHIDNLIEGEGPFDTLMTTGKFKYRFTAGFPNIVAPYKKTLTILAKANEQENTISAQAVVLGKRPRLVNFTSTSPQLPLMILRDPPGDGSSATIEKGTTVCNGWSIGASADVKASIGLEMDLGTKQQIISGTPAVGKITEIGFENSLDLGVSMKTGATVNHSGEVCMTATETISTSGGDVIIGEDADVYVGGALNLLFGITDDLRWDTLNCSFYIKPGLLVFPDKFATTFLYSGYQIKKVVIPNLELVGDTASANQWRSILQRNADLKAAAVFEKNLSFDAGVTYQNSTSIENSQSTSFGFSVEIGASYAQTIGFDIDGLGSKVKLGMELNMGVNTEFSTSQSNTQTVGYTLSDDDIKDVFTVNVLQDKVYGTPVFKTISGNSSCPYEPNTVPRDGVELTVDKTIISNVNENAQAVYKFNVGNTSQTDEYRSYVFELYNATNPNSAIVKVQGGGQSGTFGMSAGQSQEVTVTIERGPTAYDYDNMTFHVYSACEGARYDALGFGDFPPAPFYKAINVSTHFLEPCSPIDIGNPLQNWVQTLADGDFLFITLNDFNRYDSDLSLIRVQYRLKQGDGAWINIAEVPKADLDNDVFKIVPWNTAVLRDGEYEIRAVTECVGGQNAGISHVITGRFEREAPALFGTPEPADGVLSAGDEISIRFTEPIRCDQIIQADFFDNNNIGLYNTETGELVDATISCQGDKIVIVPKVPNRFIENKVLRVEVDNIKDLANNLFVHAQWEFVVDRNPVHWEGGKVKVTKLKDEVVTVKRRIVNEGGQATDYLIEGVPSWVRVFPLGGNLLPGASEEITFEFNDQMAYGSFLDTISINPPLGLETLIVDCRVMCKPPEWGFDAPAYSQTMNFAVKLNIEGTLSTDEEDIVAAFIDGEVRGTAKVQLLPTLPPLGTQYMAFLTVYGNDDDYNKPVHLEIWDASECLRYGQVLESFNFEADNVIGTVGTPQVIHTNSLVRRDIPINNGWNWLSFNLKFPNPALNQS